VQIANAGLNRHPWLQDRHGRYLRLHGGATVFRMMKAPPGAIESHHKGCIVTDTSRHASVKVCVKHGANLHTRLVVIRGGHKLQVSRHPPELPGGNWEYGSLSPNNQQLLAQWSGECEVPQAYLVNTTTGVITPIGSSRAVNAPESYAVGWSAAGLPIVDFPRGACGAGLSSAGVYLTSTTGHVGHELIATRGQVVMWS
jgi:hypothetical protein